MQKSARLVSLLIVITALIAGAWPATAFAATDPFLGGSSTAGNFAVLAGSTITNTGPTRVYGQMGVAPGSSVVGFPPGQSGAVHNADPVAIQGQVDLTAAYVNAAGQPCPPGPPPGGNDYTGLNLGGRTLGPGVYCQTTAPTITGTLTLNGSGIYIFQIGSTLVTASGVNGASVVLIGGAQPCQVFWQVGSSATIGTSTVFVGNIMALTSISMQTGASLNGRALARNAAVTLDSNTITQSAGCGYAAGVPGPTPAATPTPAAPAATPTPTGTQVGLPNAGGPPQQPGFPWLPMAAAGTLGALLLGFRVRVHRRDS